MPLFFTHLRNSAYYAGDDGVEYESAEAALAAGMHSAMRMAADEITDVCRSTAIEITIKQSDGTSLLSSVLSISISPLIVTVGQGLDDASSINSQF